MPYLPGTHVIASLTTTNQHSLDTFGDFKELADQLILRFELQKLGEVYHDFQPKGFTAAICLSESHISVHTWPEFGRISLDIYLSNYQRNNDGTVKALYQAFITFFAATILQEQTIQR
jgi:S-adenosylmethionine decarboxylase